MRDVANRVVLELATSHNLQHVCAVRSATPAGMSCGLSRARRHEQRKHQVSIHLSAMLCMHNSFAAFWLAGRTEASTGHNFSFHQLASRRCVFAA